jgi:hypothetical protein
MGPPDRPRSPASTGQGRSQLWVTTELMFTHRTGKNVVVLTQISVALPFGYVCASSKAAYPVHRGWPRHGEGTVSDLLVDERVAVRRPPGGGFSLAVHLSW